MIENPHPRSLTWFIPGNSKTSTGPSIFTFKSFRSLILKNKYFFKTPTQIPGELIEHSSTLRAETTPIRSTIDIESQSISPVPCNKLMKGNSPDQLPKSTDVVPPNFFLKSVFRSPCFGSQRLSIPIFRTILPCTKHTDASRTLCIFDKGYCYHSPYSNVPYLGVYKACTCQNKIMDAFYKSPTIAAVHQLESKKFYPGCCSYYNFSAHSKCGVNHLQNYNKILSSTPTGTCLLCSNCQLCPENAHLLNGTHGICTHCNEFHRPLEFKLIPEMGNEYIRFSSPSYKNLGLLHTQPVFKKHVYLETRPLFSPCRLCAIIQGAHEFAPNNWKFLSPWFTFTMINFIVFKMNAIPIILFGLLSFVLFRIMLQSRR